MSPAGDLEHLLGRLREQGGRVTTARRAVLATLLDAEEHLSADDLAAAVQARHPDVHLSTIYRTLDAFERLGVVTHVHLGHGRAAYHLSTQVHHHAVCEACGQVIELPAEIFESVDRRLRDDFGFTAEAHHFAFSGTCAACRSADPN